MKRRYGWLPILAAPITVIGHVVSEAIASGKDVLTVAREPAHLVLLLLVLLAFPMWLRAARRRRLGYTMAAVVALSLLVEGNGLSAAALAVAIAISLVIAWLGGWAIERASLAMVLVVRGRFHAPLAPTVGPRVPRHGPYFAFVATRGNRPPPALLGSLFTHSI